MEKVNDDRASYLSLNKIELKHNALHESFERKEKE
jgi:hypothetical protein